MFENVNLVRKLAWSFHRTTGIDWSELFSEACMAYLEAMQSYDSSKGAKTTWAYHGIRGQLIIFCKQERRFKHPEGIEDWYSYSDDFEELFSVEKKLSPITKEIVEMVLHDPKRYAIYPPLKAVGKIRQDLRDVKKWTWPKVEEGMRTLRAELK